MIFQSFCIFSCILALLIILKKPRTTKVQDRRAFGDCVTSGSLSVVSFILITDCICCMDYLLVYDTQNARQGCGIYMNKIIQQCENLSNSQEFSTILHDSDWPRRHLRENSPQNEYIAKGVLQCIWSFYFLFFYSEFCLTGAIIQQLFECEGKFPMI